VDLTTHTIYSSRSARITVRCDVRLMRGL
jgi:hypothetical protein